MRLGARGDWDFHLFYSPEETDSAFGLYLPYIAIGQVVGLFIDENAPELVAALAIAFQLFRITSSIILTLAIYRFIAEFIHAPKTRWLTLLVITFGGGLGWILVLLGQGKLFGTQPVEFYIPEGFSFLVHLLLPHVSLARAAILIGLVFLFRALHYQSWRDAAIAGLFWNGVGLLVTFYLAVIYALLGAWGLALWIKTRHFPRNYALFSGLAATSTAPLFLYNTWIFSQHETFAQWSSQNELPSPSPLHYLLGYGVLAVFAWIGAKWAWKKGQEKFSLLVSWVLIVPILVYLPINVQRRLAEAVFVPLVILAIVGLKLLTRHTNRYLWVRRLVLVAVLPSMFLLWIGAIFTLTVPDYPAFRPNAETKAMDWLANYAAPDTRILSTLDTGNYLPARTNLRPFLGHGPETLYSKQKSKLVERFYTGELSNEEKNELFTNFHIRYVMFGELERRMNKEASLWNSDLILIYDQDNYQIYEVPN